MLAAKSGDLSSIPLVHIACCKEETNFYKLYSDFDMLTCTPPPHNTLFCQELANDKTNKEQDIVVHTCNPSSREAEAGEML